MFEFRAEQWETSRGAAYRILRRISEQWGLSDEEERKLWQMSHHAHNEAHRNKALGPGKNSMRMASLVVRTYFFIGCIWPYDEAIQRKWMKRRNWRSPFFGKTPLEVALQNSEGIFCISDTLSGMLIDRGGGAISATQVVYPDEILTLEDEDEDLLAEMILRISGLWGFSHSEWFPVFGVSRQRIMNTAAGRRHLCAEAAERIRCALTMHGCYRGLLSGMDADALAAVYAKTPHRLFGNVAPLSLLKSGNLLQMREVAEKAKEEFLFYGHRV